MKALNILFASNNAGKVAEAREHAQALGIILLAPPDLSDRGKPPAVEETSGSYLGNARLKARAFLHWSGLPSLADDAGLEVEALPGELGVETAYYAGPQATALQNNEKLLERMADIPAASRQARFLCQLVLSYPEGHALEVTGELKGSIATAIYGKGGFGYDSVFVPEGFDRTLADLKEQGREVETHRTRALNKLFEKLK